MMRCVPNTPSEMLIVQGTGGGKLAVPQNVGSVTCDATLVIENTLSLSADQHSKTKNANPGHRLIKPFHLDSIRSERNRQNMCELLDHLPHNTNATIFLFSSPEFLLKEQWKKCMQSLLQKKHIEVSMS